MFDLFQKITVALIFWAIFMVVIFQLPYPQTLSQANALQILGFFIPLFLAISFTINLFLKNLFSSSSISLGIIFLLILKALDSLNLVTGTIIVIVVLLLVSYFRKIKKQKKSLTKLPKIPKLHAVRKQ